MIVLDYLPSKNKLIIKCENEKTFSLLREHFSVVDKNSSFKQNRFKRYGVKIPSRKYCITPTGQCDIGLYEELNNYFIEKQIVEKISITPLLQSALNIGKQWLLNNNLNIQLRDYQKEVVQKAITAGCGTCVLGTGAGKTFVTAALIESFHLNASRKSTFKCLMVVPDIGLVEQTYNEFQKSGITAHITKWSGANTLDINANIIICNIQILQSQLAENNWIKHVDLLVIDECHKIRPDNKISKIITTIKTRHKYGFTGTLPEDAYDRWFIIGKIGPVLYKKSSYELRTENFLSNVEIKILRLNYSNNFIPKTDKSEYRSELNFIHNCDKRNTIIQRLCHKLTSNTLILVNHIIHGEILFNKLSPLTDKQVFFIQGEINVEERERIKQIMEKDSNVICIAISAIFSTGVNVTNIHNIIFAAGGKSFIRTVQSIGRGLRLHNQKKRLLIIDIYENLKYSIRHQLNRQNIYITEKIQYTEKVIDITQ
jgi:superfamily II DNA or RNA helicase